MFVRSVIMFDCVCLFVTERKVATARVSEKDRRTECMMMVRSTNLISIQEPASSSRTPRMSTRVSVVSLLHITSGHRKMVGEGRLTIDTAGTTFSRFGVIPRNSPRKPSLPTVFFVTSHTPS